MARSRRYKVAFRRRREGKTDYNLRRKLVISGKTRVVVRRSNTQTFVQLVNSQDKGDKTLSFTSSKSVVDLGWKGNTNNIPAAYLTGYYFGKKTKLNKSVSEDDTLVLDIGLTRKFYGGKLFATLKGAVDAGMNITFGSDKIFPSEERIRGEHISNYESALKDKKEKDHRFTKMGIKPNEIPKHFDEIKSKIENATTLK